MKRSPQVNARRQVASRPRVVFGVHPVEEYLTRGAASLELLVAAPANPTRDRLTRLAETAGLKVNRTSTQALSDLCGSDGHQGVVLRLPAFQYAELESAASSRPDLLVAVDGLEDPRNLGALLRSAAAAGAGGVVMARDRAVPVTPVVEKAAAGVTAWFPVVRVVNLARALATLKRDFGYWATALVQDGDASLYAADLPAPTLLVVGGETGIRPLVRQNCDLSVRIPMAPGVESLNLAVAAALGCFEVRRRLVDRTGGRW